MNDIDESSASHIAGGNVELGFTPTQSHLEARDFIFVRSLDAGNATVRLQSEPILRGLRNLPGFEARLCEAKSLPGLMVNNLSCIILHYNDRKAEKAVREIMQGSSKLLVVVLCSDIYSYSRYVELHDIADLYIAPTEAHQKILSAQLYKPVYTIQECIDPIATCGGVTAKRKRASDAPGKASKRVVWFGYADSFVKSMASLMPIIERNIATGNIDDFHLILNRQQYDRRYRDIFDLPTIEYDSKTFLETISNFDYAILSHFALDLEVNSYIKSPNKAITAFVAGVVPICSDTPNYRALFSRYGLEKFLFSSPRELDGIIKSFDLDADLRAIQESNVIPSLLSDCSQERATEKFLNSLAHFQNRSDTKEYASLSPRPVPSATSLRAHLSDIVPSAVRALKARMR